MPRWRQQEEDTPSYRCFEKDCRVDWMHHHCSECGGLMTTASGIHPMCRVRADIEVEVDAFKQREKEREEKEKGEEDDRSAGRRRFW